MNSMDNSFDDKIREDKVRKKVKSMQGFYKHLIVYLVINIVLLLMKLINLKPGETFFDWGTFSTAICWGIGVFFHWYGVFGADIVLGKDWEEKKIKEMMGKKNQPSNKWE